MSSILSGPQCANLWHGLVIPLPVKTIICTLLYQIELLVYWSIFWFCRCDFNMRHFPYDVQHCTVKMGSWTYDRSDVISCLFVFVFLLPLSICLEGSLSALPLLSWTVHGCHLSVRTAQAPWFLPRPLHNSCHPNGITCALYICPACHPETSLYTGWGIYVEP